MPTPKIIFLHGNDTLRWSYAWLPWLRDELQKLDCEVVAETLPDSILAREKYWIAWLAERIGTDESTILIGHSSGALCAMRYAEQDCLRGSVLICAAHTDLDDDLERQSGYFDRPWQWGQIKRNQQWIAQFASTDDPYIPIAKARHIAVQLDSEYHEHTDRGHFFTGQSKFPELLTLLTNKLADL